MARVDKALRLLRKVSISRAGKALESKGLGDMTDAEVLQQLREKFPPRVSDIQHDTYSYEPEEDLQLKLDKNPS
jgi:hypothetical protein